MQAPAQLMMPERGNSPQPQMQVPAVQKSPWSGEQLQIGGAPPQPKAQAWVVVAKPQS